MRRGFMATFVCLFVTGASAHAFLQHAQPGADAKLKSAPKELVLNFSEPLEPDFSGVDVMDAAGHGVEASPATVSGPVITAVLKPLQPGQYRVKWHAISKDSHRTDGQFTFTVQP
ncbi:MAG: copper resistance protein CopC [Alphaproteobacteria bacterium]|nr:copper resistance protein CopC [Alphaproteobacteria bacterium]